MQIIGFQESVLGRDGSSRAMTRIPAAVFTDVRPQGALYALMAALHQQRAAAGIASLAFSDSTKACLFVGGGCRAALSRGIGPCFVLIRLLFFEAVT